VSCYATAISADFWKSRLNNLLAHHHFNFNRLQKMHICIYRMLFDFPISHIYLIWIRHHM